MHGRHGLPWQATRDAYKIWLSEIMLQQTQVATVLPYYARFLERFPDVATLAAASEDEVLAHWAGLGYYSRARNLHKAAKQVVQMHGGTFPDDVDLLADLPGVGRSTAAAIAAFAYDVIAPILDGNVKRVLARHAGVDGFPGASAVERRLWQEAQHRLPKQREDMVAYTQGLMDLGATICTKSDPHCLSCPVANDCVAKGEGRIADIPAPRPSKRIPERSQRYLLALHGNDVLLVKRPAPGIWGGLWCLPELAEDDEAATVARVRFGVVQSAGEITLPTFRHAFTHFRLTLAVTQLIATQIGSTVNAPGVVWLPRDELHNAALPKPISALLSMLNRAG
jgi:A/G-specific adenine glycosylase